MSAGEEMRNERREEMKGREGSEWIV